MMVCRFRVRIRVPIFKKPVIYWTPVIAPGNIAFYSGAMFPQWQGAALIGSLARQDAHPRHVRREGRGNRW